MSEERGPSSAAEAAVETPRAARDALSSMTGQGSAHVDIAGAAVRVGVEIRSVNHRHLDPRVRGEGALGDHAHVAEDIVRRRLVRGRVEVVVTLDGVRSAPQLDLERAAAALTQLRVLRDRHSPGEPVPLSLLASVPDLFGAADARIAPDVLASAVREATERACDAVEAMRRREGEALRADLEARLDLVLAIVARVEARRPEVVNAARHRLRERIARLLDPGTALDAGKIEHEVAIFADRTDVAEECTRLAAHVAEVRRVLVEPMDGRGKRLDFLCQELAREANTLGQKSADLEIGARVIDLKCEIERMREQTQNVL